MNPLNGLLEIQMSTHHFGPLDPVGFIRNSAFRLIKHDDLIPGLPVPGDLVITNGPDDGLPIPGLSFRVSMFGDSGDVFVVSHNVGT